MIFFFFFKKNLAIFICLLFKTYSTFRGSIVKIDLGFPKAGEVLNNKKG